MSGDSEWRTARLHAEMKRGQEVGQRWARLAYFEGLVAAKRIKVEPNMPWHRARTTRVKTVRIVNSIVWFDDPEEGFPSEKLIANIALALESGVGRK